MKEKELIERHCAALF